MHSGRATRLTVPLLICATAMALYGPHHRTFTPISRVAYMAIIAGFALLVLLATTHHGQFLCLAPLRFLGRISYPLYLVHQGAGFALLDRLRAAAVPLVVAVPITITAAIMLAWVISTSVEWPAQRWLRARIAGYQRSARAGEINPRLS